ncbi:hypothetical protein AX16_002327 [Volvariella volvacea WC 439]|nr:hypothetical protein AX16_002327 [Volvariella volvacea WC 439]
MDITSPGVQPSKITPTPIIRLPSDIVREVFEYVTWDALSSRSKLSLFYTPHLSLTAVCRHWRDVALSHGPLWTTILLTDSLVKPSHINQVHTFERMDMLTGLTPRHNQFYTLDIGPTPDSKALAFLLLSHPIPSLRQLRLSDLYLGEFDATLFNDTPPLLPGIAIFPFHAPWRS